MRVRVRIRVRVRVRARVRVRVRVRVRFAWKGGKPVRSSYMMTPHDHHSLATFD